MPPLERQMIECSLLGPGTRLIILSFPEETITPYYYYKQAEICERYSVVLHTPAYVSPLY